MYIVQHSFSEVILVWPELFFTFFSFFIDLFCPFFSTVQRTSIVWFLINKNTQKTIDNLLIIGEVSTYTFSGISGRILNSGLKLARWKKLEERPFSWKNKDFPIPGTSLSKRTPKEEVRQSYGVLEVKELPYPEHDFLKKKTPKEDFRRGSVFVEGLSIAGCRKWLLVEENGIFIAGHVSLWQKRTHLKRS